MSILPASCLARQNTVRLHSAAVEKHIQMHVLQKCTFPHADMLHMNPLALAAGFLSPHQTKHCNSSGAPCQADLRPLKVSRWVCGGQTCQSCGFQLRAERLLCGGTLLSYMCHVSVRGVLLFLHVAARAQWWELKLAEGFRQQRG